MPEGWQWDKTLFAGRAPYYFRGRLLYSPRLVQEIADRIQPDGTDRLLDLGCGPVTVTLPFAPHFREVIGLDPDQGMIAEAIRRAMDAGITTARWICARAEDVGPEVGAADVITIAQSVH